MSSSCCIDIRVKKITMLLCSFSLKEVFYTQSIAFFLCYLYYTRETYMRRQT